MLLSVQSQSIQNKGEISGIKQQQQNALETQEDNEEEYQKEHRHRILHAIISIFTHIVNIVMTVLRPVKHIAKAVSKSLSKALNKGIKKATNGMMKHFGLAKPMQRVGKGVQKSIKSGIKEPGLGSRALTHIANGGLEDFIKRTTIINTVGNSINKIDDGIFGMQTAKLKEEIAIIKTNMELIDYNCQLSESIKQQEQDNIKTQVNENIQMLEDINSAVNALGNLNMQVIAKAA
jgi:hypothetical protein